jgi:hypothetical protein
MRWWQIRRRDADLERELRSDLDLEEKKSSVRTVCQPRRRDLRLGVHSETQLSLKNTLGKRGAP